ncbi:MAG TPA: S-layer homology domain-containing protein, partial [Clostridia bacterium]
MKRNACIMAAIFSMLFTIQVSAIPPEFAGGVNNEYEYKEYVFLSGQPVLFKGTIKESDSGTADKKTISYTFALKPDDTSITGKLDRQATYIVTGSKRDDKGQTISQTALSKMKETVNINGVVFDLKDYQFSKSDVIDNRPVSDYYSGNVNGRKYYTINKTEGTVTVDISGGDVGYQNFWGSTDTLKLTNVINYERKTTSSSTGSTSTTSSAAAAGSTSGTTETSWHGTVEIVTSDSTTKTMDYSQNDASYSSFQGGYLKVTGREMLSTFNYDLPLIKSGVPDDTLRKKSVVNLSDDMVPQIQRLVVPKFKDVAGHWAEEYIGKLYSLDVFDD